MTSPDDYAAIHAGAAIGAIAPRGQIALAGPDRATVPPRSSHQRHGVAHGRPRLLRRLADTAGAHAVRPARARIGRPDPASTSRRRTCEQVADRLEQFHFTEDVQIADAPRSLRSVWIHGPAARAGDARRRVRRVGWSSIRTRAIELCRVSVVVARIDQLAVPGFVIYVDAQQEDGSDGGTRRARSAARDTRDARRRAHRSRLSRVRHRHDGRHDSARGGHRGPRDLVDEGLLRRAGSDHPRAASRSRQGRAQARPPAG